MANNFKGYLLRATKTNRILPEKYIAVESWDSTPNQREEIKAWRDENTRNLFRVTAKGKKTSFQFSTIDGLHLADKIEFQKFFTSAESNADERKINLEYWNDEKNKYDTGDFYRPNMNFPIQEHTADDIIYKAMTFEFVEY